MDIEAIKEILGQAFPNADIKADVEGSHLQLQIVSELFAGLSPLKKQQQVYKVLNDKIANGEIHAVNMKLLTPE